MMMMRLLGMLAAALVLAPATLGGGPSMAVGAADDIFLQPTLEGATAKLQLARAAGLGAVRVTPVWDQGEKTPTAQEFRELENVAPAAAVDMRVFVSVYPFGSRTTPLTDAARAEFAAYAASIPRRVPELRDFI